MAVCVWLLSFSVIISRFIHVVRISNSFLFIAEYFIVWVYHICLFIDQLVDILCYFPFWAIMNNVA